MSHEFIQYLVFYVLRTSSLTVVSGDVGFIVPGMIILILSLLKDAL
jgi:hypothetical protein